MKDSYYLKDGDQVTVMAFLSPDAGNSMADKVYVLNRIAVALGTEKGQGWGTKLLRHICAEADANNVTLVLGVDPDDAKMFNRLKAWYIRHGFQRRRRSLNPVSNVMVRHPK